MRRRAKPEAERPGGLSEYAHPPMRRAIVAILVLQAYLILAPNGEAP